MNITYPHNVASMRILTTTFAAAGLAISLTTICLCMWLSAKRKELRKMTIVRVIMLLQILEALKCTFDIVGTNVNASGEAGCRVFVFFMLVLAAAPLNLSVFCMLYFQAVLIHKTPLFRRQPQAVAVSALAIYSILPELFTLFIPPQVAGMSTYCEYRSAPNRRLFIFQWLVFYIWVTLACVAGVYSIISVVFVIRKRASKVRSRMCSTSTTGSQPSTNVPNDVVAMNIAVAKESAKIRRRGSLTVIVKTLRSMIWFPIVPIVYLGFNTIYSIVWYRTQRESKAIFIIDRALQLLAVLLFALPFYFNPSVRRALKRYRLDKGRPSSQPSDSTLEPGGLQSIDTQSRSSSSNSSAEIPAPPSPTADIGNRLSPPASDSSTLYRNCSVHSVNLDSH